MLSNYRKISPQVILYEAGLQPSHIPESWVALPQLPSGAFGDGTHPTTRLCAGAVEFLGRRQTISCVLDVGTGTGVLARIARARGAQFVIGTDIDPAALTAARNNVTLDSHAVEITLLNASPDTWGPRFNLIVANILEDPLKELGQALSNALAPGGILLLSGFTRLQVSSLRMSFEDHGLTFLNGSYLDNWALLMFRREAES